MSSLNAAIILDRGIPDPGEQGDVPFGKPRRSASTSCIIL